MVYCTVEDVEGLTGMQFTGMTMPNRTEAEEAINTIYYELNGIAQAAGYSVPVSSTEALGLMKRYNMFGASCDIYHHGFRSEAQLPPNAEHWCTTYQNFLTRLRDGEIQLPGLTPESDNDPVFLIKPQIPRDYYLTDQEVLD